MDGRKVTGEIPRLRESVRVPEDLLIKDRTDGCGLSRAFLLGILTHQLVDVVGRLISPVGDRSSADTATYQNDLRSMECIMDNCSEAPEDAPRIHASRSLDSTWVDM